MSVGQHQPVKHSGPEQHRARLIARQSSAILIRAIDVEVAAGPCVGDISSPTHARLSVVLGTVGGRVESRLRPDQPERHGPFTMSFMPPGEPVWGYTLSLRRLREIQLDFDAELVAEALGQKLTIPRAPRVFHDQPLRQLAGCIAAECEQPGQFSQLYLDSLTLAACIAFLRLSPEPTTRATGRLAPQQLRRVTEYMLEHLAEPLSLGELARLAGLSQSQFGRTFIATTGVTPHRWLVQARIARAQELLLARSLPQGEIALLTGFAEQSHFCRVFKQIVGVTPGSWQREHVAPRTF